MRITIILLLLFLACKQRNQKTEKNLTPLSRWLVLNEDSLFVAFNKALKNDTIGDTKGNQYVTWREYKFEEGYFKQLTDRIHEFDPSIYVYYIYRPRQTPYIDILLSSLDNEISSMYNENCIWAIDSAFSDIDSLKYFSIVKYWPPHDIFSSFIFVNEEENKTDTILPEKLGFELKANGERFDLKIYLKKRVMEITKETLIADILGEEIRLKKINTIRFIDSVKQPMTLNEFREFFNIKN